MKKVVISILISISLFMAVDVNAKEKDTVKCTNEVNIYIFRGEGCPHCEAALEFFDSIEDTYGSCFNLVQYEVWNDEDNASLMQSVASYFGEEVSGVPYIIIGDKTFSGYAESYDDQIKEAIVTASNNEEYTDVVGSLTSNSVISTSDDDSDSDTAASTIATVLILLVCIGGIVALVITNKKSKN